MYLLMHYIIMFKNWFIHVHCTAIIISSVLEIKIQKPCTKISFNALHNYIHELIYMYILHCTSTLYFENKDSKYVSILDLKQFLKGHQV